MFPSPNDYSKAVPLVNRHTEMCRDETPTRHVSYRIENIKVRFTFAKGLLEKSSPQSRSVLCEFPTRCVLYLLNKVVVFKVEFEQENLS